MSAHRLGDLVGGGAAFQRQIQNLQIPLIELVHKGEIEVTLALGGIGLLQPLSQLRAAADGDAEAAGGPQQELHIAFHVAVVRLRHCGGAVDEGSVNGNPALVPLQSDGDGLFRALQVGLPPDAEGNEAGVQLGWMLHLVFNA